MEALVCDGVRTPIGRYGGALSSIRTDDLAALAIAALMTRNARVDWAAVDDVIYGSANQAGSVESMSRAPFVMPKATSANAVFDTTIGWGFINPKMQAQYGVDSIPETVDHCCGR